MPNQFPFIVRDPLLGDVRLTEPERQVLDSDAFQRQRGVKQLGTAMLVYPSAVQTRFVHALGNLQIISEMYDAAIRNSDEQAVGRFLESARPWVALAEGSSAERGAINDRVRQVVRIAGMCHDLGHLPLSHVLEYAIKAAVVERRVTGEDYVEATDKPHEYATRKLLEQNGVTSRRLFAVEWLRAAVTEVITMAQTREDKRRGHPVACALADLVSSEIDSDRAEYLRRDNYVSGAGYGQYDTDRITNSLVLVETGPNFRIRPSGRALQAVEAFLLERVRSHQHLYYHPVGVLMDALVTAVLKSAFTLSALAEMKGKRKKALEGTLKRLRPEDLHYTKLVDPRGYVDDATLWEYLRAIHRHAEDAPPESHEYEYRRLRTYLRILLRREHLWVSLWKRAEDFAEASALAMESFCRVLEIVHKIHLDDEQRKRVREQMAQDLMQPPRSTPPRVKELSCLNYLAHRHKSRLVLAPILEALLRADSELERLNTTFFVEIGMREFFRPLKDPESYALVAKDGTLKPFAELAPASLQAIESLWFEGIQIRVYVLCERELEEDLRETLRSRALKHLGTAIESWYVQEQINFYGKREVPRSTA